MPCFNEEGTIRDIVAKVLAADRHGLDIELIIVDDGSWDKSREIIAELRKSDDRIKSIFQGTEIGEGRRSPGRDYISVGEIVLIQDADRRYEPREYNKLLTPIIERQRRCGLRLEVHRRRKSPCSVFLAQCCKPHTDSDVQYDNQPEPHRYGVLYKIFRKEIIKEIDIKEDRFGFEPEITAKIARLRPPPRIYEVGISYQARTYEEGKKIGLKDAFRAVYCILRYGYSWGAKSAGPAGYRDTWKRTAVQIMKWSREKHAVAPGIK